jgi:hypothetical protein
VIARHDERIAAYYTEDEASSEQIPHQRSERRRYVTQWGKGDLTRPAYSE